MLFFFAMQLLSNLYIVRRVRGPALQQKLKSLYDAIKDHRDNKGRQLASIFMKLPSKTVLLLTLIILISLCKVLF